MFQKFKAFMKKKPKNVPIKKIILGICAMDKKARSKPMREILKRLPEELFEVIIFGDECILNENIETWPAVDVLISFFSKNFPTEKAVEYVKLRKPYMLNDLEIVEILKDRRCVYDILESQGINVPMHVYLDRSDPDAVNIVEEFDEVRNDQKKYYYIYNYFSIYY
jgi:inositol hexakisphosphate/diphosphoinositol-pentakisphosphate kinase